MDPQRTFSSVCRKMSTRNGCVPIEEFIQQNFSDHQIIQAGMSINDVTHTYMSRMFYADYHDFHDFDFVHH